MILLGSVSAASDAMTPLLIISSPIRARDALLSHRLRQDEDVMLRRRSHASVNEDLSFEYISDVYIPDVATLRSRPGMESEIGVLCMDSALPHRSRRILQLLNENNIIVITFPAQTINLFEALDLVFFDAFKKLKATAQGESDGDPVNAQITKRIQAYEQGATCAPIRGSFRKAGMDLDVTVRQFRI
jgi:hypothetical protein